MAERRTTQIRAARALLVAVAATALTVIAPAAADPTAEPSTEELKAARELFQEAYKDEQDKRFADALDKFQRVAKVKESASVRYRIATCLAALGRLRESRDMYRALAATKGTLPAADREIADSASERAANLDHKIPHLSIRVQDNPPPDARVSIDGAPVPVSTTPRSIELDPGEHVITSASPSSTPHEQTITLVEGAGEVPHTVTFSEERKEDKPPPPPTPAPPPPPPPSHTLAYVLMGAGAALGVGGVAFLFAREGAVDDIKTACPGNVCPTAKRDDVESATSRAELFGPLSVGLSVAGLAAIGVGVYLLVRPTPVPAAVQVRALSPRGGFFSVTF